MMQELYGDFYRDFRLLTKYNGGGLDVSAAAQIILNVA